VINSLGKVSYFTKQGEFIKELKTGTVSDFYPIDDSFIGTNEIIEGKTTFQTLNIYDGKVFSAPGSDMIINVMDGNGKLLYTLNHPYEKFNVTESYKQTTLDFFKTDPRWRMNFQLIKTMGRFPEKFHAVRYFQVDESGIYVQTYGEKEGKSEFYRFDLKGKFIAKVYIPFIDDIGNIIDRRIPNFN